MVNIVQNYAEAVYYWHNSTGIYAGRTGERGVNLLARMAKQPEVTRRLRAPQEMTIRRAGRYRV